MLAEVELLAAGDHRQRLARHPDESRRSLPTVPEGHPHAVSWLDQPHEVVERADVLRAAGAAKHTSSIHPRDLSIVMLHLLLESARLGQGSVQRGGRLPRAVPRPARALPVEVSRRLPSRGRVRSARRRVDETRTRRRGRSAHAHRVGARFVGYGLHFVAVLGFTTD
ncbi:MAG: hypothetical protein OXU81_11235 [Gammaproteobacteria bacterium]|nr:hypothetical protein [Gammaproteobacteria bacterium]